MSTNTSRAESSVPKTKETPKKPHLSFAKFKVTLGGGTFDIPVSFDDDDEQEATMFVVDDIADFDPISVSRGMEGQGRVRYVRIPVKGGYIVVKIVTYKRKKRFDAEIRKLRARKNISESHLRCAIYFFIVHSCIEFIISTLFADDERSDQHFRVIEIEKGFFEKIFVDAREYELTVEGVLATEAPEDDIEPLDGDEYEKTTLGSPEKMK